MSGKMIVAALTIAVLGLVVPEGARAHRPGHGWGGAGWHHHGYWHGGFWPGVGIGVGPGWPYATGYYDYPFYTVPFAYEGYGGCHVARQRVMTRAGWRVRLVDVCE